MTTGRINQVTAVDTAQQLWTTECGWGKF